MATTDVIGVVQEGGMVRTKGEPSGPLWECEEGHRILHKHLWGVAGDEITASLAVCDNNSHVGPGCALRPRVDRRSDAKPERPMMLPADSASRKEIPIVTGVLDYFPLAIAAVARLSKKGNDKHNPGQPLHWSRDKSTDHADCIGKHLVDRGAIDPDSGMSHTVNIAWRALALLELEEEARLGKPMARGSEVSS